jgi:hypothetical protein
MDDRIKQLADKAQEYAEWTTPQGLEWFPTFKEKFAELIVQECAEIADCSWRTQCPGFMIKEHFGVETWKKSSFR